MTFRHEGSGAKCPTGRRGLLTEPDSRPWFNRKVHTSRGRGIRGTARSGGSGSPIAERTEGPA